MPKIFVYLITVIVVIAAISVSKTLLTESMYYDKLCNGVVEKRKIQILTVLRGMEIFSYVGAGIGLVSAIMYTLILIQFIPT